LIEAAQWEEGGDAPLREIPGNVPSPFDMPRGCSFAPRCPAVIARCRGEAPALGEVAPGRPVACFVAHGERA
jgi:oligopeptide/dipeptide ABC transporter ATP-binding protein